jgi:hypothetical protein
VKLEEAQYVRFGSGADICAATSHVRSTPNSDRESGFPQEVMSALPLKADVCGAVADVCYGPEADTAAHLEFERWERLPGAFALQMTLRSA